MLILMFRYQQNNFSSDMNFDMNKIIIMPCKTHGLSVLLFITLPVSNCIIPF